MYTILSLTRLRIKLGHTAMAVAAASFVLGALPAHSQAPGARPDSLRPPMGEVTTAAEFQRKIQASKTIGEYKSVPRDPSLGEQEVKNDPNEDCILLYDGSSYTRVPIGSVLALPANYRNRVIDKPKGPLLPWPDFLAKNKDWVGGWEVPMKMVYGDADQSKIVMKALSQDTRVLVALLKGNPITVLEPEPETEKAPNKAGAARK
ncbi:hypothetical protein [Roseimicrobium sp. ORNL1]|uniref:hypothetical protein n=1 Tax=Roseimicrobium sp. ORNL1 TaxID=2711231 RepID=UPI0013E1960E|nr:hypothetical protein [Roseimicrobium sp. ORNL1]QIF04780.1 hypothetical protein G5S37_25775 [Roseimicrobium sp. ORNL1]